MSLRESLILVREPASEAAEQFRSLLVNLMRTRRNLRGVLVTSCWPGEGKTLVAANLAAALARIGRQVILIDGDLRRPALTHLLESKEVAGLRDYLEKSLTVEDLDGATELDKVRFIPAGTGRANPVELLSDHERVADLLDYHRESFVMVDSPPLSVCSDGLLLGPHLDGALLVVHADRWDGRGEAEYAGRLAEHGIELLGVVLNAVNDTELVHGYGYHTAGGHYYRYYDRQSEGRERRGWWSRLRGK